MIRENKDFTAAVLNAMVDSYFLFDPATRKALRWNRAFRETSGYGEGEIARLPVPDAYFGPTDLARAEAFIRTVMREGAGIMELELIRKDGTGVPTEYRVSTVGEAGREARYLVAIGRDVTERRRAERELRSRDILFRTAIESFPADLFCLDRDQRYTLQNSHCQNLWGNSIGKCPKDIAPNEQISLVWEENNRRALAGETFIREFSAAVRGEERHFYNIISPIKDGETITGILGINIDVTERKEMEKQLRQSEKMQAIGQLAGGIAHDFNNQLGCILGYADLLRESASPDAPAAELCDKIITSAGRAADLTSKLLAFSRLGNYERSPVDVHRLIAEVADMLRHTVDKRVAINLRLAARTATVLGDASRLQNTLLNLGLNARDAMPEGGELLFATENVAFQEPKRENLSQELPPGEYLRVAVRDTGAGIAAQHLPLIFEPFFTTKAPGKGTGMGLAAVYGTVASHGGALEVRSEPGKGATFAIYLLSRPDVTPVERISREEKTPRGQGTILLVDDEAVFCEVARRLLTSLGYDVTVCHDGQQAIDRFRAQAGAFDLVILDMVMPGLSGKEVFERMKDSDPGVKVLIASGYSAGTEVQAVIRSGAAAFIQKPFTRTALADKIAEITGQSNLGAVGRSLH